MGALHSGHASLLEQARKKADVVIASVFVNPTQFGPNEDFDKYPRTLEKDIELCSEIGVDCVFAPSAEQMYGVENIKDKIELSNNYLTYVSPAFFFANTLCGKTRQGHFDGVCTVVLKLFNLTQCDFAFFGQKDAQQLIIIKKMVKDLNLNVEICPCEIVRDKDGLALSSRNKYLTLEARQKALCLSKCLKTIENLYHNGVFDTKILFDAAIACLEKDVELEYLEFVDLSDLAKVENAQENTLVAIAAKIDGIRLIDNVILKSKGKTGFNE